MGRLSGPDRDRGAFGWGRATRHRDDVWATRGGPAEVRQARALVSESMRDQSEEARDTAVLLADECVANAVRHGGGRFELTIRRSPAALRVEVADQSPRLPIALAAEPDSERGRGVAIVSRLASRWGAEPDRANGKVVWFELSLD